MYTIIKEVEVEVYSFNELSEEAQESALLKFNDSISYDYWDNWQKNLSHYIIDLLEERWGDIVNDIELSWIYSDTYGADRLSVNVSEFLPDGINGDMVSYWSNSGCSWIHSLEVEDEERFKGEELWELEILTGKVIEDMAEEVREEAYKYLRKMEKEFYEYLREVVEDMENSYDINGEVVVL